MSIRGAVLVVRGDAVLTESAGDPPGTRYQLASVSKQFTAAAVLLQVQRGTVRLDDPVGRWLGGSPPAWRDITLHHLLTHTAGLGHWHDHPAIDLGRPIEPEELLAAFHRAPLRFPPGARWYYSSPGYVLLAHVVQRVADRPYREVLDEDVFAPLGMTATFAGNPAGRTEVAAGHGTDGGPVPSWELDVVNMGAGDVWSTTGDVLRWIDGLRAGRLLTGEFRELMLTERVATGKGPDERGYGYGWFTGDLDGRHWFHHSGENAGFRAFDACLPGSYIRIAVLSNTDATSPDQLRDLLADVLG